MLPFAVTSFVRVVPSAEVSLWNFDSLPRCRPTRTEEKSFRRCPRRGRRFARRPMRCGSPDYSTGRCRSVPAACRRGGFRDLTPAAEAPPSYGSTEEYNVPLFGCSGGARSPATISPSTFVAGVHGGQDDRAPYREPRSHSRRAGAKAAGTQSTLGRRILCRPFLFSPSVASSSSLRNPYRLYGTAEVCSTRSAEFHPARGNGLRTVANRPARISSRLAI